MADLYGSHFEFAGISSRQWGLIIANANTSRMMQLGGAKEGVTIFSRSANKRYLIDDDYAASPVSFDIEIVTDSDRCLEPVERRQIEKWLFNHRNYRKLYLDAADDIYGETYEYIDGVRKRSYLNCRLINPERLEGNGGIVGYKATLEADSNMFWQDAITKKYLIHNGAEGISTNITVPVDTDLDAFIYPSVTIQIGSVGGDITICNHHDDSARLTRFVAMSPHSSVTMKGELNYVSGSYYEKFADRNFIRLLDGENKLTVLGDVASIEFAYAARRAL